MIDLIEILNPNNAQINYPDCLWDSLKVKKIKSAVSILFIIQ